MIWIYLAVAFVTVALFLFYIRQMRINVKMMRLFDSTLSLFAAQTEFNNGVIESLNELKEGK